MMTDKRHLATAQRGSRPGVKQSNSVNTLYSVPTLLIHEIMSAEMI